MGYGIRLRNTANSTLMELTGQSAHTAYRQPLGATTNGTTMTVSGLDPACDVVFIIVNGDVFDEVPLYTISGNVVTFHWNGSPETTYILHAVMFS